MQHEITEPGPLLNADGLLAQEGYARSLILEYNRGNIAHGWHRIKEWDYYLIMAPDYALALTVSEMGILTLCGVSWMDFRDRSFESGDVFFPFTRGRTNMPRSSESGDISVLDKKIRAQNLRAPGVRRLLWEFPGFMKGRGFSCDLVLRQPAELESMVIASSWKEKRTAFYYNQKINCMPAAGMVRIGTEEFSFKEDSAFGVLDWGRGVWTYRNRWYWGSLSGYVNGRSVGWNIGYGFSDRAKASENMIFYDGRAHKIEDVAFHIPEKKGRREYLGPWSFTSSDNRFEMSFEPLLDRSADVNLLLFRSVQHQVFGYYTGVLVLDDGTRIAIDRMLGFAEDVYNRW